MIRRNWNYHNHPLVETITTKLITVESLTDKHVFIDLFTLQICGEMNSIAVIGQLWRCRHYLIGCCKIKCTIIAVHCFALTITVVTAPNDLFTQTKQRVGCRPVTATAILTHCYSCWLLPVCNRQWVFSVDNCLFVNWKHFIYIKDNFAAITKIIVLVIILKLL